MRGCSTCCHPTHLASPPTYPLPLLRLQTTSSSSSSCLFIISTADGGRLCGTFRAHLFTTFFSSFLGEFFDFVDASTRVLSFSVDGYISFPTKPPRPVFISTRQSWNHFSVFSFSFIYLFKTIFFLLLLFSFYLYRVQLLLYRPKWTFFSFCFFLGGWRWW